jgi:hypothetical protein
MTVFQLYSEQTRLSIDVFADYPLDFEELWQHGVELQLAGATPRIASIDHLIGMKRAVGRQQDLLDVEKLEKIKRILDVEGGGPR